MYMLGCRFTLFTARNHIMREINVCKNGWLFETFDRLGVPIPVAFRRTYCIAISQSKCSGEQPFFNVDKSINE